MNGWIDELMNWWIDELILGFRQLITNEWDEVRSNQINRSWWVFFILAAVPDGEPGRQVLVHGGQREYHAEAGIPVGVHGLVGVHGHLRRRDAAIAAQVHGDRGRTRSRDLLRPHGQTPGEVKALQ